MSSLVVMADTASERDLGIVTRLACGALAGTVGQTVAYPFDVARRRMQVPPRHSPPPPPGSNSLLSQLSEFPAPVSEVGSAKILNLLYSAARRPCRWSPLAILNLTKPALSTSCKLLLLELSFFDVPCSLQSIGDYFCGYCSHEHSLFMQSQPSTPNYCSGLG